MAHRKKIRIRGASPSRKKKHKKKNHKLMDNRDMGQMAVDVEGFKKIVMNKPLIQSEIEKLIEQVVEIFKSYDRIQILGGLGLILIDNLPTPDKMFGAQMFGENLQLDDAAEPVMEYAMNFGTAMIAENNTPPTKEVLDDLYNMLKQLHYLFNLYDMPTSDTDFEAWLTWMVHMDHIHVRGEGYAPIIERVFDDLFAPHDAFLKAKYGFGFESLKRFCTEIERFILSKIETAYGAYLAWERWKEDSEKRYGTGDDAIENMLKDKPENGVMGSMSDRSPDMFAGGAMHVLMYQPDDFGNSDKIFWVVPQNEEDKALYEKLSRRFGDNAAFLADGDYKGNVMSGMELYKKPLVKVGDNYYCFTPMIPHRNMIAIAESLIKEDSRYYDQHYRSNIDPQSRDQYMERRVAGLFAQMIPDAIIYPSVKYGTVDNGKIVKTELDVLCVSGKAIYVVEIKGHELTNADKVKIKGFKDKFKDSVGYGCHQACRAENHVLNEDAQFHKGKDTITVEKSLPIYKVVVTLQHFSSVIGHFNYLVNGGLMDKAFWNVWAVSLYDLVVIADHIKSEQDLMDYITIHGQIQHEGIEFQDELDVFAHYLDGNIQEEIKQHPAIIIGGADIFDNKYSGMLTIEKGDVTKI